MSDYEDEDSRTLFCANLSEKVTEELLYELFLQGGPLEKVKLPKDKDGRPRSFGFITYVHAISVSYAVSLFHGTCLFNRELTLKPRHKNNSNTQERPDRTVAYQELQPICNPSNDNTSNYDQQRCARNDELLSLRSGFNQIQTKASSMLPQPLPANRFHSQNEFSNASVDALLKMGGNMLHTGNASTFDKRFLDRDRHSNHYKMTSRHHRPHHKDLPYSHKRGSSPPRRDASSRHGSDRRRR